MVIVPAIIAAQSPLLQWREPVYIVAGFAGILALGLLFLQPLIVAGRLPYLPRPRGRMLHRWTGLLLIVAVLVHVGGLWMFSPPDLIDALLLRSPTPFSVWGVIAMWALFGAGTLACFRTRLPLYMWRAGHSFLVITVAISSVIHAMLVQGAMGSLSKSMLCLGVLVALALTLRDLRSWKLPRSRKG